jgi:hypothetical protein
MANPFYDDNSLVAKGLNSLGNFVSGQLKQNDNNSSLSTPAIMGQTVKTPVVAPISNTAPASQVKSTGLLNTPKTATTQSTATKSSGLLNTPTSTATQKTTYKIGNDIYDAQTNQKIPDVATLQKNYAGAKMVAAPTTASSTPTSNSGLIQSFGVAPFSTPATPAAPTNVAPTTGSQNASNSGLIQSLANTSATGSPTANAAATGLLGLAGTNSATNGAYQTELANAQRDYQTLQNNIAAQTKGISTETTPLSVEQGEQGAANAQNSSLLAAAQNRVLSAQQAIQNQISGVQTQQSGYNSAGGLGNTAQSMAQSGLSTAIGATQPTALNYGTPLVNPQTGQVLGGTGTTGDISSTINYWANQIAQNKASINDVPATISGNVQLKTQLQQAIQGINPSYNPSTQQASQQTAADLTAQTNQLQATLNGAEANFQLLTNTAAQGGVNDMNVPALNALMQNAQKDLASNSDVINFQSTLATVRSQYAAILGGGSVTVDAQNRAQSAIPDNISLGALQSLQQQMKQEAQNRIVGNQNQIKQLSGGSNSSNQDLSWDNI